MGDSSPVKLRVLTITESQNFVMYLIPGMSPCTGYQAIFKYINSSTNVMLFRRSSDMTYLSPCWFVLSITPSNVL